MHFPEHMQAALIEVAQKGSILRIQAFIKDNEFALSQKMRKLPLILFHRSPFAVEDPRYLI